MAKLETLLDAAGLVKLANGQIVSRSAKPGVTPLYNVTVQQRGKSVKMLDMLAADVQRLAGAFPVLAIESAAMTLEEKTTSMDRFYSRR